jgi:pimeloyl-ACP methyl ester carboxylesterase
MRKTGRAVREADSHLLDGIGDIPIPVLVEFGGDDIYVTAADVLRRRFPKARHESLPESGHLPWLQDSKHFRELLAGFYASVAE